MTDNDRNMQGEAETIQLNPMVLIMQMRREMEMLKKKNKEEIQGMKRKNVKEIATLKKENTQTKQKLNGDPTVQETIEGEEEVYFLLPSSMSTLELSIQSMMIRWW